MPVARYLLWISIARAIQTRRTTGVQYTYQFHEPGKINITWVRAREKAEGGRRQERKTERVRSPVSPRREKVARRWAAREGG